MNFIRPFYTTIITEYDFALSQYDQLLPETVVVIVVVVVVELIVVEVDDKIKTKRSVPLFSKGLACGFLFFFSREEQFQRSFLSWFWHSWTPIWIPWMADAVTSGYILHRLYCRGVRSGNVLQTVLGSNLGSLGGIFKRRISLLIPLWNE